MTGWMGIGLIRACLRRDRRSLLETLAQQLEGEINPYWNTNRGEDRRPSPQPGVENPYWRLDPMPVNDPDGEPLGHALHMVVYPGVERDPDAVGSPALAADEPFRMLEMAHFETTAAVDAFGKEFNGYLVPGLLGSPNWLRRWHGWKDCLLSGKRSKGTKLKRTRTLN